MAFASPRITPYLLYEDLDGALQWLTKAFGMHDLGGSTQSLYVRVENVDAMFERAVSAGAVVLEQPADQPYGDRRCGLEDPEGHRWYFAQALAKP